MMPPAKSSDSDVAKNNKEICVDRFKHWWPTDEGLREIINLVLPKRGTAKNLLEITENKPIGDLSQRVDDLLESAFKNIK